MRFKRNFILATLVLVVAGCSWYRRSRHSSSLMDYLYPEAIIDEFFAALKGWRKIARQLGMSAADIAVYATAIQSDV